MKHCHETTGLTIIILHSLPCSDQNNIYRHIVTFHSNYTCTQLVQIDQTRICITSVIIIYILITHTWPICMHKHNNNNNWRGREPKWANPELNMGNCLKSSKMDYKSYIVLYQIFKKVNFLQLMKWILNIVSRFGGLSQHLWVSPLWLSIYYSMRTCVHFRTCHASTKSILLVPLHILIIIAYRFSAQACTL